ncbi:molybdenum cofactor biosysynthesis protein [Virgisporangium aurantiacum]|uniref:Molybdenum cofactor biosysynthesis protein n=1 Tax=Virgisporangium aurantiacum TaxID=175570 RepID=A0A8J4DX11_9ACTN|nr:molybdenum cofactor biosysynthesis protein [Virgisporangium aurantiacum]
MTYPVKAARGTASATAKVEPWGLADDRRWAIVDDRHRTVDVVNCPAIMTITPHVQADGGLMLTAPGRRPALVALPGPQAPRIAVGSADLDLSVAGAPDVDAWLAAVLGRPARLVRQDEPHRKPMSADDGGRDGDVVSLAHAAPVLLTSIVSLHQLDRWITAGTEPAPPPLDVMRFRPNIVVDGFPAFAEDSWRRVTVGDVGFRASAPCYRCAVTLIDPDTLARGKEPLRTLARHRKHGNRLHFGIWLVPAGDGDLHVGDAVTPS